MGVTGSEYRRRLLLVGSVGIVALLAGVRLVESDPNPWPWVALFAGGTSLLAGPLKWVVRVRIPRERRETLSYVSVVLALACVPIVLGVGLVAGGLLFYLDAAILGSAIGFLAVWLAEQTAIPARLQSSTQ